MERGCCGLVSDHPRSVRNWTHWSIADKFVAGRELDPVINNQRKDQVTDTGAGGSGLKCTSTVLKKVGGVLVYMQMHDCWACAANWWTTNLLTSLITQCNYHSKKEMEFTACLLNHDKQKDAGCTSRLSYLQLLQKLITPQHSCFFLLLQECLCSNFKRLLVSSITPCRVTVWWLLWFLVYSHT